VILDAEREVIRRHLILDEGIRLNPYKDSVGKLTIGIGRNLTDVGISHLEAYDLLNHDIDRAIAALVGRFSWFQDQDSVRQVVLVELCFNMGPASLSKFVNTLAAFERKDYPAAADGLRKSKWFRQVQSSRSARIIQMVLTGEVS
jgi:lysozyme